MDPGAFATWAVSSTHGDKGRKEPPLTGPGRHSCAKLLCSLLSGTLEEAPPGLGRRREEGTETIGRDTKNPSNTCHPKVFYFPRRLPLRWASAAIMTWELTRRRFFRAINSKYIYDRVVCQFSVHQCSLAVFPPCSGRHRGH